MTIGFRRNIIRQAMIELSGWLLHLLPQEMEGGKFLASFFIDIKIDIVAHGGCSVFQSTDARFARAKVSVSNFFSRPFAACSSRKRAYSSRVFAANSDFNCSLNNEFTTPTAREASSTCTVLAR